MLALRLNLPRNCTPLVSVEIAGKIRGFDSLGVFIFLTYLHILNIIFIFSLSLPLSHPSPVSFPSSLSQCPGFVCFPVFLSSSRIVEAKKKKKERENALEVVSLPAFGR